MHVLKEQGGVARLDNDQNCSIILQKHMRCVCVCGFLQVERFWLQSDALAVVLAGLVLGGPKGGLMKRLGHRGLWRISGWVVTLGMLAHMAHSNYR